MTWPEAVEAFAGACRERGLTEGSVGVYRRNLSAFASWYEQTTGAPPELAAVTALDVADFRRCLQARRKPPTVNRHLKSLRTFFAWAVAEGHAEHNPASGVRRVPEPALGPRSLDRRQLGQLLREVQRSGNVRDLTLVTLLAQTGLRISEALGLRVGDVMIRERSGWVSVLRKGGKADEIPLNLTARRQLAAYLNTLPNREPGAWLFPGRRPGRPLSPRAVQRAMSLYARRAGLSEPGLVRVSPHVLRHTALKTLVDNGVPLDRVAALAGHASLSTTARYTRPTPRDLERAVEALEWV